MVGRLIERAPSAYGYPLLIKHLLQAPMRKSLGQEIVYRDLRRLTYADLRHRIGRLANGLEAIGVRAGDTVGVMDWDSNRFLEAFFAIPMMGAVLQTVNVRLAPEQIAYTINHAGASTLLVNEDFADIIHSIGPNLPKVRAIVLMSDRPQSGVKDVKIVGEYEALLSSASPEYDFPDFDENTQATTFYTSGTTGLPKGVYFSHRQIVLHTLTELAIFGFGSQRGGFGRPDVYMPMTPMFHVHAWGLPWSATAAGLKQVYPGRYAADFLIKLIKAERVTFTHGVPTLLEMLLAAAERAKVDLANLTMMIGGSALTKTLAAKALSQGLNLYTGYGMSESGPLLALAHVRSHDLLEAAEQSGDVCDMEGTAVPLVDIRIIDATSKDLPRDGKASGEVVARAPWLSQGYFNNPDASEQLWTGGYMHTGDIARIWPDDYVQITDRIKDVIKSGGEWVSSLDLENIISQHSGVSEVAVVGVKDPKWGERPIAIIVPDPSPASPTTVDQIDAYLRSCVAKGAIPKFAIPARILFVGHLPKTSVGKIDKKALRQKYDGQNS